MAGFIVTTVFATRMSGIIRKLACCLLLLMLAGTVSGAGFLAADRAGFTGRETPYGTDFRGAHESVCTKLPYRDALHKNGDCHFPLWKLPAYYVCVMVCKIGGGGEACSGRCENIMLECR